MLGAAALTFFFIGQKPERYKASVILATGIVNYKGINSDNSDAFVQQYQVDNAFSNLIEFTQSRSTIKVLTIEMLRHDLSASANGPEKPFRQPNPALINMSAEEFAKTGRSLLAEINKISLDSLADPSFSQQFDYLLDRAARSYGYDHDAFRRSLGVKRKGQTDYLSIDITTENPVLSQYMANTYVNHFMAYYQNLAVREKRKTVESFTQLAAEKKAVVDSITELYFDYMKSRSLPALGKQSEELVAQISKMEIDQQRAQARKRSAAESVERIDKYIGDRSTRDARETQGRVIEKNSTDDQFQRVRDLTKQSLEKGGKDPEIETQLAEAKTDLEKSVRSSAKTLGKPRTDESKHTKEDLYKEKVSIDMDRIEAEGSADRLGQEIYSLKSKLSSMVTSDEISSKLKEEENRARDEYDAADKQRINAKMNLENAENPLSIVENAQIPEWPEPNRQVLISVFAAIVVGTLTCIALFLLAYSDNTLQTPELFSKYSGGLPLLGSVTAIPVKGLDFKQVFGTNGATPAFTAFRESLRRIRSTLLQSKDHIFLIVSTKGKEGKTFSLHALAYSLAANNKKVLMLDTNFKTPIPEAFFDQPTPNAVLLNKIIRDNGLAEVFQLKKKTDSPEPGEHLIDIIGNTGLHRSPSELLEPDAFRNFLAQLREHYDYILLESAALNQYSDAQELVMYVDKIIAIFNARSVIKPADKESVQFLHDLKGQFAGAVLTEM